jgi:hypothetical protein
MSMRYSPLVSPVKWYSCILCCGCATKPTSTVLRHLHAATVSVLAAKLG